jgi:hypothetical protein
MEAAGGIYTSLRDLARYAAFQLAAYPPRDDPDPGPLRRSSVREAHAVERHLGLSVRPHEPTEARPSTVTAQASGIGLAWHAFESCELESVVGHSGATDGYSAAVELLPERGVALVSLANFRDADHQTILNRAREVLLESKGMEPRLRPVSEGLARMIAGLVDLYDNFREARYRELAAPLFVDAAPPAEVARETERLQKRHGACKDPRPLVVRNAFSARFAVACERGWLELDVGIDGGGRLVEAHASSRDGAAAPGTAAGDGKCLER